MTIDDAEKLVRRLAALGDEHQRVAILGEEALRLGVHGFADLLSVIIDRASERRLERDQLALTTVMAYLDSISFTERQRVELITVCRVNGYSQLLRLLFVPEESHKQEVERVPDYGVGRPLTLGERKSLARRPSRQVLERVLADPHPAVIRNVLRNPKLTETDVIRMVSRRPNYAKVLREVYQSPRWGRRYPIKLALARNPYTPPVISLKLLPQLMRQDLEEMLKDRGLHTSVLIACRRLVEGEIQSHPDHKQDDDLTVH